MVEWDSMGRAITQTFGRAFQTHGWALAFLLNPQKLVRVFQKPGWPHVLKQMLGRVFWSTDTLRYYAPFNPLSANFTKWANTLKQFVGKLPTNCLNVFDHFVVLALKGLRWEKLSRCSTKLIHFCKKIPIALDCRQSKYYL